MYQLILKLNKTEKYFKNDDLQNEIKKIHNDNDIFEYYISSLFRYFRNSGNFYLRATEHPIRKTTKNPWGLNQ